jgi:hypothetical protein
MSKAAQPAKRDVKRDVNAGQKSWTVAVFMVGERELANAMNIDFLELAKVGSSAEVNVVAAQQRAANGVTTWYEIPKGTAEQPSRRNKVGKGSESGVALAERLDDFLQFLLKEYPAKHYLVVLWGHGSGLRFGNLGPRAFRDRVELRQLASTFQRFQEKRGGEKIEVLGFSSCAISKAEFALELRDVAQFLVSSQIAINSLMTWPFDDILGGLVLSPQVAPPGLVNQIMRSFQDYYEPPPVALTALNLEKSEVLKRQVSDLAGAILSVLARFDVAQLTNEQKDALRDADDSTKIKSAAERLSPELFVAFYDCLAIYQAFLDALNPVPLEHEDVVDFFDFCLKIVIYLDEHEGPAEEVRRVAQQIMNAGAQPFVAQNVRAGPNLHALNGLSLIAPDFMEKDWPEQWDDERQKEQDHCWLWKETAWPDMIKALHGFTRVLPPSMIEQAIN